MVERGSSHCLYVLKGDMFAPHLPFLEIYYDSNIQGGDKRFDIMSFLYAKSCPFFFCSLLCFHDIHSIIYLRKKKKKKKKKDFLTYIP